MASLRAIYPIRITVVAKRLIACVVFGAEALDANLMRINQRRISLFYARNMN
jgi:hypothetical protein